MKNRYIILFLVIIIYSFNSCSEYLDKPIGSDLTINEIFSSREKAISAISRAYNYGLLSLDPDRDDWFGIMSDMSGENNPVHHNWEIAYKIQRAGMLADSGDGRANCDDNYNHNYWSIRQSFLVMENIDMVEDMTEAEKQSVKGEMLALVAYRYVEMFKRYGGVPLVKKSLSITQDEVKINRSSLKETLDFILELCNEALPLLPDAQDAFSQGRATKGFALAIKAEALIYAARPLFNSSTPYLDFGEHNNLICFGNTDPALWQRAADASMALIDWSLQNGHFIINTGKPLDDYGNAVATPGNKEVIIANRALNPNVAEFYYQHSPRGRKNGMGFLQLQQYYKQDGTDQTWPAFKEVKPYSDYYTRIQDIEARYKASVMGAGIDAWNNPNDEYWSSLVISSAEAWVTYAQLEASGRPVKFYYHAGKRSWFDFPVYRLAEFYLNAAEAYNELGQPAKSHEYLNVIRKRAGLPNINEANQEALRKIIQREWAIEFYMEEHRLFDVKHWKLTDIGNGIIGGPKYSLWWFYKPGRSHGSIPEDYESYTVEKMYDGFWNASQYLNPFPLNEVTKGYLVQNPGY